MRMLLSCGDTNFYFLNEKFTLFFINFLSKYFLSKLERVLQLFLCIGNKDNNMSMVMGLDDMVAKVISKF